jgi:cellulose synthase/poly-beta-1,6-N-acetylglucosamine synthase-like glycosyltransferase
MGFLFFGQIIFNLTLIIFGSYLLLGIVSANCTQEISASKNSYVNYNCFVHFTAKPRISIIAPAFNESKTIIDNVRTQLISLFKIILRYPVNDGSNRPIPY